MEFILCTYIVDMVFRSYQYIMDILFLCHRNLLWAELIKLLLSWNPDSLHSTDDKFKKLWQNISLWPSDAIWWHRSGSTLAQVMACCLKAPSHYLNQCWFIITDVFWHSHEGNFTRNAQDIYRSYEFENYEFKIAVASPRGQWVNFILWVY